MCSQTVGRGQRGSKGGLWPTPQGGAGVFISGTGSGWLRMILAGGLESALRGETDRVTIIVALTGVAGRH